MCFWSKTEQTSKATLETMRRAFSILGSLRRTFILVSETLGHLHLQSKIFDMTERQPDDFFFFCWKEMFLHEKHCICCPRCRHFYKSEFRFHSLLAHFIICIFLLYRLNIFCQLMTFFFLWTVLKPQLSWWWINCAPLVLGYSVGWMHTS